MALPDKLLKPYDPKATEERIYKLWEESGFFNPDKLPGERKEPFTLVMPPPNVTGILSIGHALMLTIEDIMIRYNRMRGKKTLWLPGTDHAAIATQAKVEADLYKKEGKTRHDFPREDFLRLVEKFAQESHDTIIRQTKSMGASADWSREAYTLDDKRTLAVRTAFKKMYDDGIIYRGYRIVNWDPKLKTTVSDDEIEWKEEKTPLYYLKYGPFTIATARPETKFGDKYVVMHPDDKRYKKWKDGQKIEVEWINGPIVATVIKDSVIDMEFGTGVMTITPAHDTADFEIAERQKLDSEQIIDEKGLLLPVAGEFAGQHIKKARPLIMEKLQKKGLVEKIDESYIHRVATNSRGGGIIEPQIKLQWFVAVNKEIPGRKKTLKNLMREPVEKGEIKIIPEFFSKTYFHWIDNLRDWCISRQIWYGHRVPVWYCNKFAHDAGIKHPRADEPIHVGEPIDKCPYCGLAVEQDPDTLDTWFSSGLWTFSTLGWPEDSKDLKTFHPTDVLETGYDILFFWVARMILMTTYLLGDIPFRTVYLHGLVRAPDKQKMSKSKGNIIDPLDIIEKYGTDALRFALIFNSAPGIDQAWAEDKVRGMKNFANKLWNITRFVLETTKEYKYDSNFKNYENMDEVLKTSRDELFKQITKEMEGMKLHLASENLYYYGWHKFADDIIEKSKNIFKTGSDSEKKSRAQFLLDTLTKLVKMLHPFMPFVTEEIWSVLPWSKGLLMVQPWPHEYDK